MHAAKPAAEEPKHATEPAPTLLRPMGEIIARDLIQKVHPATPMLVPKLPLAIMLEPDGEPEAIVFARR